jgi:hypothetical protein
VKTALQIVCNKTIEVLTAGNKADEFHYLYQSEGNSERFS